MNWSTVAQSVLVAALLLVAGLFVVQAVPEFAGADYSLVVQSGSMEPAIGTGSMVFVAERSPRSVETGDVITYSDDGGNLVTHRVVETHFAESSFRFVTKGDANDARDPEPVFRGDYVGTVTFSVPLLGYVIAFGQTRLGWAVMVLVPVLLVISNELWTLYRAVERTEDKQ